ncbi:MAG: alanine racemase, partial [Bacteroidota bacterium]
GDQQISAQQAIFEEASQVADHVWTVGPVFDHLALGNAYPDTEQLLAQLSYDNFLDSTVLLKGARDFQLERVIPLLQRKLNATYFQIDLNRLSQNFRWLKSHLAESVKTMCMVKAASYGAGTWEIAQQLEREGAHYLAVAYASEGIELRQAGIQQPIMVMNPDLSSVEALLQFKLEPEVSNFPFLKRYLQTARLSGLPQYRIHLKLETGMGRLGFMEEDLPKLIDLLGSHPDLEVTSVMSHLSASDDPSQDEYSHQQAHRFQVMYHRLQAELGLVAFRHLLNTAGLLRFPQYHFDMVRMGIGLYGIDPRAEQTTSELAEIGSLHSNITQIHTHQAGDSIGYGRAQRVEQESKIAIVPIGYADGIPRSLGLGKQSFLVEGKWAPTVGRICMDMMMLDVSHIPGVAPGQEVVLIGSQVDNLLSVRDLAQAANTIPYEILVRISPRVRRVYVRE